MVFEPVFLLEAATISIVAVIIITGIVLLGYSDVPADIAGCGIAFAHALALGLGFGMCNAVMCILSVTYKRVLDILMRLLYFCSGVMYSVDIVPEEIERYLFWNPVLHCIELFRMSYFPEHQMPFVSKSYILIWALCLGLAGVLGARIAGARLNQA